MIKLGTINGIEWAIGYTDQYVLGKVSRYAKDQIGKKNGQDYVIAKAGEEYIKVVKYHGTVSRCIDLFVEMKQGQIVSETKGDIKDLIEVLKEMNILRRELISTYDR